MQKEIEKQVEKQVEKDSEKESKMKFVGKVVEHVAPFKNLCCKVDRPSAKLRNDSTICVKPVAKVVDGKPGMTIPDFSDQVSVKKLVDSYKNETGLAYALRQINQGRLMPSQLFDKGNQGGDVSKMPDNVNDAYREHLEAADAAKKVANALDITKLDDKRIDDMVAAAVKQKFDAYIASQTKKEGEQK